MSIKIIHTADLHFDSKADILEEVVRCSDFLLDHAKEIRPDAILITGDLMDQRLYLDSEGALAGLSFVKRLAEISPCLLVKGTELHDFNSLKTLTGYPNVMVVDDVRQVYFSKKVGGFYHLNDVRLHANAMDPICGADAVISCLPSLSKAFLASLGRDMDTAQEEVQGLARDVMRGWGEINREVREHGVATILAAHGTAAGAVTSTGQVMVGHDITYGTDDLRAADADYTAFGHIHKMQRVGPAYYSGSIGRLNSGEQEEKGFFVVEIEAGVKAKPVFVKTPAREFIVVDLGTNPENWQDALKEHLAGKNISPNSVIKIKTTVAEENISSIVKKDVELVVGRPIMFDKTVIPIQRTRAEGISKLHGSRDKYLLYAESSGVRKDEEMLKRVDMLDLPVEDLVRTVEARFSDQPVPLPAAHPEPPISTGVKDAPVVVETVEAPAPVKKKRASKKKEPELQAALL